MDLVSGQILNQTQPKVLCVERRKDVGDYKGTTAHDAGPAPLPIDAVAYAPDGMSINVICGRHIIELNSETLSPGCVRGLPFEEDEDTIWCMAVTPHPGHIALGRESGLITILDVETLSVVREIRVHTSVINSLAFSPDGSHLASTSDDWSVRIWEVSSGDLFLMPYVGNEKHFCSVTFSPDGKRVACGSWDGTITVWDAESSESIGKLSLPDNPGWPAFFLAYSPDNTNVVAVVANETEWQWVRPNEAVGAPPPSKARFHCLAVDPDGSRMYRGVQQTTIQVWDVDVLARPITNHCYYSVSSVALSPDGKRIAAGTNDLTVRVWDAGSGVLLRMSAMQHSDYIRFVCFSPDGKHISSGGDDMDIRIWDAETGHPVRALEGHTHSVSYGAYSPDGTRFVSCSRDATVRLWDSSSWQQLKVMTEHTEWVCAVAFSPDGSLIASATDEDKSIRLWNGYTCEPVGEPLIGHTSYPLCVAFSPDGKQLASGAWADVVRIWDVRMACNIGNISGGHASPTYSVVFSLDGRHVLSSERDGAICCWDVPSGSSVGTPLTGHRLRTNSIAISSDGEHIISGSEDTSIRVWNYQDIYLDADYGHIGCGIRGVDKLPVQIPADGWIRTTKGELLLWVPTEYRGAVCDISQLCIGREEEKRSVRIAWDKIRHGDNWTSICDL